MKLVFVLILCLVHQRRAEPLLFEAISDGAMFAGSLANVGLDVARGVIGAGVDFISNLEKDSIAESENDIGNKILGRVLQKAQITIQQIQDGSREISQANADAGNRIEKRIAYLKNMQQAKVTAVAGEAKKKLSKSSKEAQEKGQALLRHFSNESSKYLNRCINQIVAQFRKVQATANAVGRQFQEPLNTLAAQVGKCTKLRAANTHSRGLVRCAIETHKALKPLEAAPTKFSWEKAHLARAEQQPLLRRTCVLRALAKFSIEADSVGKKIDQLVAEDKKKTAPKSQPNAPPKTANGEMSPAKTEPAATTPAKTAPVETAPAKTAPSAKSVPAEASPAQTEPADTSPAKTAAVETAPAKTAPAETSPAKTAPTEISAVKTALAESAIGKTVPAESAQEITSPPETALTMTAPAKTAPSAKTVPAEAAPAKTEPADTSPAKTAAVETAPAKTAPLVKTAPAETSPAKTAPAEISPGKTALAESALGKTAPAETAQEKTSPPETAPTMTAPAETAPAKTAPSAKTVAAETSPAKIAPAETCFSTRNS